MSTFRLETFSDGVFAIAVTLLALFGGLLVAEVRVPDVAVFGWLLLLVVGGRSAVRLWSARHRRVADTQVTPPR